MDKLLYINLANSNLYTTLLDYPILLLISLLLILLSVTLNAPYFASCAFLQVCIFRYTLPKRPLTTSLYAANSKTFSISTYVYCAAYIYFSVFKLRRQYNTLRDSNLSAFYNIAILESANSL